MRAPKRFDGARKIASIPPSRRHSRASMNSNDKTRHLGLHDQEIKNVTYESVLKRNAQARLINYQNTSIYRTKENCNSMMVLRSVRIKKDKKFHAQ